MVQMSTILPSFAGYTITHGSFHLRLIEQLGAGAYGVVYVARDLAPRPRGAQFYAVKCMLRHPSGSPLAQQQQREIAHHRTLSDHPNVVTLHTVIEEEYYIYLVLDLCEGGDLFNAIMERDTYVNNSAAVKHTFLQVIDVLAACHEKGIYHRDLKPENILCSEDDQHVYLSDFGLATRSKRSMNFGCGSSFYMSPECLGIYHKKTPYATKSSDVWALGTILCNLLTGRNPWHIASPKIDDGFRLYLREGAAWLHKNLPISMTAAELLGRIFDVDPATRITIPELRAAVIAIDSFYPGDTESHRPNVVGFRPKSWELQPIPVSPTLSPDFTHMSPDAISAAAAATLALSGTVSTFVNNTDAMSVDSAEDDVWSINGPPPPLAVSPQSSSDMSDDSEVPFTPETWAADSAASIDPFDSDFSLDDDRGRHAVSKRVGDLRMDKLTRSLGRLVSGIRMPLARGVKMRA